MRKDPDRGSVYVSRRMPTLWLAVCLLFLPKDEMGQVQVEPCAVAQRGAYSMVRKAEKVLPGEYVTKVDPVFERFVDSKWNRKRTKVLVSTLTLTSVSQEAYGTHCVDFYGMGKESGRYNFMFITPRRMPIDALRNWSVELAIKGGFKYIYFFDDDTVSDKRTCVRLLPRMKEFNAVSAGYFVRGYPFHPMVFRWINKEKGQMELFPWKTYQNDIDPDGVLRKNVAAVGNGCTMYRVKDFTKIPYPWFHTGVTYTEDVFWFLQASKQLKNYKVGMDFNINCGHLCLPAYVDKLNVDVMRRFHKQLRKVGGLSQ